MTVAEFLAASKPVNKYGAKRRLYNGVVYDSALEARMAIRLDGMQERGEVLRWLRQVPLTFKNGKRTRVDALVFFRDGRVEIWEAKGQPSRDWPWIEASLRTEYSDWPLRVFSKGDL